MDSSALLVYIRRRRESSPQTPPGYRVNMISTVQKALLFGLGVAFAFPADHATVKLETRTALDTGIANIHVEVVAASTGTVHVSYGGCGALSQKETHHDVAKGVQVLVSSRLVWRVPDDSPGGGCLAAWDSGTGALVARSAALNIGVKRKRSFRPALGRRGAPAVKMDNSSGIDTAGPWFDGVAYLQGRNVSQVDVEEAKSKRMPSFPPSVVRAFANDCVKGIGIIGGGMSGLMTAVWH